jgi:hypothetical protein
MKDERFNSNIITPLRLVIGSEIVDLKKKFKTIFFSNAFLKTYQYVTLNEKVCKSLKYAFIKFAKENLEKSIT